MGFGKFITFEGGEGAGKSTQAQALARRLGAERGVEVALTREPGGSALAEKIRELVLSQTPAARETEFLLFAAARAEHIATLIGPALKAGRWVICDRYIDSTRVYQGDLGGVSRPLIDAVERHTVGSYVPDLTIVLDVPAELAMSRALERGTLSRFDAASADQHQLLRDGFLKLAKGEPERCVVIDGARDVDVVADDVFSVVCERILKEAR